MNYHNVKFIMSAGKASDLPNINNPHVVISGKSNVGKSSLINKILNRKNFARVSATPGKTITINFYDIDGALTLVDLPGYGYAKVSKSVQKMWAPLVESYLTNCGNIAFFMQLVDIRHAPTEHDKIMVDYVRQCGFAFCVIATKSDKLSNNQKKDALALLADELEITNFETLIPFSSKSAEGKDEILNILNSIT